MKIKKFEEVNEHVDMDEVEQNINLISDYLFDIQDNFHKLTNRSILLKSLKNDLSAIVDRYNLKN